MASVVRKFVVDAPLEKVWGVIGDFEHGPLKFAPSVFVECHIDKPDLRTLVFADGTHAQEQLISKDDKEHRAVWRWVDENIEHDNTTMQVNTDADGKTQVTWTHDVLPHEATDWLVPTMDKLIPIFQQSIASN